MRQPSIPETFNYSFSVWPDEKWSFPHSVFTVFEALNGRIELTLAEPDFERLRSELSHHGITVREIERVPYFPPERVA